MRSVWNDHPRFFETYFTAYPGRYFTGDGARRDTDGYLVDNGPSATSSTSRVTA